MSSIDFNVVYQYQWRTGFTHSLIKSVLMLQIGQHRTVSHVYGKYLQILFLTVVTRGGRGEQTHHCDEKKIDGLLLTSELLFFVYR